MSRLPMSEMTVGMRVPMAEIVPGPAVPVKIAVRVAAPPVRKITPAKIVEAPAEESAAEAVRAAAAWAMAFTEATATASKHAAATDEGVSKKHRWQPNWPISGEDIIPVRGGKFDRLGDQTVGIVKRRTALNAQAP